MNFFESQEQARRKTGLLVLLLVAAAAAIIALLYTVAHFAQIGQPPIITPINWDLLTHVALGVLTIIGIGSLYKIITLSSGGGAAIAESMGGQLLSSATDTGEQQLLNIVAEMALASGCPAPPVYLMPGDGINAFAAGDKLGNAVIGITHGAKNTLTREEMQGVIAHEFSHILNGDMKFNLRLIGIIHGVMLLSLMGGLLLRGAFYSSLFSRRGSFSSSRQGGGATMGIAAAGVVLLIVGAVGAFFGSLIRAAISRQREFLADASAVQFTRNPHGISNALQKIAAMSSHYNDNPRAKEFAHLFFTEGVALGFANMLASHPPLTLRIKRILPDWDGKINVRLPKAHLSSAEDSAASSQLSPQQKLSSPPDAAASMPLAGLSGGGGMLPTGLTNTADLSATSSDSAPPDLFAAIFGVNENAADIVPHAGAVTAAGFAAAEKILHALPPNIKTALGDSYSARAVVYAMLLDDKNADCRRVQCAHLESFAAHGVYELTQKLAPDISSLPRPLRLSLLLQTMPALRQLSAAQYALFADNLATLITADKKIDLFEWSLEAVLLHYLEETFGVPKHNLPSAKTAAEYALSLLAQAAADDNAKTAFTAATDRLQLSLIYDPSPFEPQKLILAMRRLNKHTPKHKRIFIQAAAECAAHDGLINTDEGILLRAFAALLDCPLPPNFAAGCVEHES